LKGIFGTSISPEQALPPAEYIYSNM